MKKITARRSWIAVFFIGSLVLLALQMKIELHWGTNAKAQDSEVPNKGPLSISRSAQPLKAQGFLDQAQPIQVRLKTLAGSVGQLTDNPEEVEKQLNLVGHSLNVDEIDYLRSAIFSPQEDGDLIATALDLLGRSDLKEAENILIDYVLQASQIQHQEQSTFQLLALEGLVDQGIRSGQTWALERVAAKTIDALVARRARQAIRSIENKGPRLEESDNSTLESLLKRNANR